MVPSYMYTCNELKFVKSLSFWFRNFKVTILRFLEILVYSIEYQIMFYLIEEQCHSSFQSMHFRWCRTYYSIEKEG